MADFDADKKEFARICRRAENGFVGMPCGILDQGVSAFGEVDSLVRIDCAEEVFSTRAMPEGTHFWIFNSNKKHALVESAYADRHKECHNALAILQKTYPEAKTLSQIDQAQLDSSRNEVSWVGIVCTIRATTLRTARRLANHCIRISAYRWWFWWSGYGFHERPRAWRRLIDAFALVSGDLAQVWSSLVCISDFSAYGATTLSNSYHDHAGRLDFLADALK